MQKLPCTNPSKNESTIGQESVGTIVHIFVHFFLLALPQICASIHQSINQSFIHSFNSCPSVHERPRARLGQRVHACMHVHALEAASLGAPGVLGEVRVVGGLLVGVDNLWCDEGKQERRCLSCGVLPNWLSAHIKRRAPAIPPCMHVCHYIISVPRVPAWGRGATTQAGRRWARRGRRLCVYVCVFRDCGGCTTPVMSAAAGLGLVRAF